MRISDWSSDVCSSDLGGVFLHDIADAGVGIDHQLIGQPAHPLAVEQLVMDELLAERPVLVEQGHARGRIGVQHLLGGNHLDLVGIGVQLQRARSEEHTSELQSLMRISYAVFCLKKKSKRD